MFVCEAQKFEVVVGTELCMLPAITVVCCGGH